MILGLTGTITRLDGKEVYIKSYCPVVDEVTIEEAVKNGWLSPHKEYLVLLDVDLTSYNNYSKEFNGAFAFFDYDFKTAMDCATNVIFRNTYARRMGFDSKIVAGVAMKWMRSMQARKKFVTSHSKKFEVAHKIIEHRQDKKIITFSATIKDSESIKYGLTMHSKRKPKENAKTLETFNIATKGVLNTSKSANVGLDVKGLSVGIIIAGDSSSINKNQRRGRVIRLEESKHAEIFNLVIKGTQEFHWFQNAAKGSHYITINEAELDLVLNGVEIETRQRDASNASLDLRF